MKKWFACKRVTGTVEAPPSKSVAQRYLALSLLGRGTVCIGGAGRADDVLAAGGMVSGLGAAVSWLEDGAIRVVSRGEVGGGQRLCCGESGLSMRMFAPLAALASREVVLEARGGLRQRPMDMLRDLESFGATVSLHRGCAPAVIRGPLHSARVAVDNGRSSQLISGLIMALSQCEGLSRLDFSGRLVSRPYVELTLDCMRRFGLHADLDEMHCLVPGNQKVIMPSSIEVEGDWSGGAFLLVAGAIKGPLRVKKLDCSSLQADQAICEALHSFGAGLIRCGEEITVIPGRPKAFAFDARDCPDLFPPLVILAAASPGISRIGGVSRLVIKECNRAQALVEMLHALGGKAGVDEAEDCLWVDGRYSLKSGLVSSRGDHRMVMAAALASLLTDSGVEVDDAACVSKSYPAFLDDFKRMGGDL